MPTLTFHGAAGTVTGSRTLLATDQHRVLVDCGLFQGKKSIRSRNWHHPGFDPRQLDAVILTHAHIDHSGYLPRLVHEGFRGPIYCTPATADLVEMLLIDSARIQEEDAEYANKKGYSRHHPALPLYTVKQAERAIRQIEVGDFHRWQEPAPGIRFRWTHAGHIIGSGLVEIALATGDEREEVNVVLSGDVGRYDAPLVPDPSAPPRCDYLVIESTYGDRDHPHGSVEEQLREHVQFILRTGGTMLVPSFAVGRAQQLVYLLDQVMEELGQRLPIHLDSPMAVNATRIYQRYPEEHGLEEVKLSAGHNVLYGNDVYLHKTKADSIRLNDLQGPRIIISSSGMMTGGRVLHHLRRLVTEDRNLVVLAGYQAPGTRGRKLQNGDSHVRIHGRDHAVRAEVASISGLSAHADCDQLLRWVKDLPPPTTTFVNHGEPEAAQALADRLTDELQFSCETPDQGDSYEL